MDQLYIISNQYYKDFYSYKEYLNSLKFNIVLSIIALLFFIYIILSYLGFPLLNNGFYSQNEKLALLFYAESIFISTWLRLDFLKEKYTATKLVNKLGSNFSELSNLKQQWLSMTFVASKFEYIELAEKFTKCLELEAKHKSSLHLKYSDAINLIYHDSAKPRILALFLALCSVISVLALKQSTGIDQVFESYKGITPAKLFTMLIIFTLALGLTLIAIRFTFYLLISLFSYFSVYMDGKRAKSDFIVRYLIKDLVKYSKVKIKTHKA
ncbi:hypothetical protein KO527_10800 [Pseudoalteromonas sp. C2R02]|uniref:hypothetical protein n=1 Tax=Pseudoalteromonas sp. C2R02 TaxID=2841565 RepID=UPI001C0881F2|nr:hypothetical protein [Pseudoalteromonas sp. C2R02]MBU2969835.1 hypothetical protein [Pseudoalteromonas sp. C2R02]